MSVELESAGINRNENIMSIANPNPEYALEIEKIFEVVKKMLKGHRRVPVIDSKDRLRGIITTSDVLDAFLRNEDFNSKISNIMIRDVITTNSEDSIGYVLQKMKLSRKGGFPIVQLGKLSGIITERDFVKRFSNTKFNLSVESLMTKKPFVTKLNISIFHCLKSMVNVHYRRLPVVDGNKLIGIITTADFLKYISDNKFSHDRLDTPIEPLVRKNVFTISRTTDVSEAVKEMKGHDVGGLLVADGGKLEGIITERDILEEII